MILQDRDINILRIILKYKHVNTDHIYGLFFGERSRAAMYHVLKRLNSLKLIRQVSFPRTTNYNLGNLIYLTKKGATVIANEDNITISETGFKNFASQFQSINHYYHKKKEIDFLIKLDQELIRLPLRVKLFFTDSERVMRNTKQVIKTQICTSDNKHTLIPDILIVLQSETNLEKERLLFVEIDTGKETIGGKYNHVSPNTLIHKYTTYEKILSDGYWKKLIATTADVFEVLTVTEKQTHIKGIINQGAPFIKWKSLFHFSTFDLVEKSGVLNGSWYNMGQEMSMIKNLV